MSFLALFLSAARLAGVLATLTVAANAFSFERYRRKNLRQFKSPIDESSDILASFNVNGTLSEISNHLLTGILLLR